MKKVKSIKNRIIMLMMTCMTVLSLTLGVSATGTSGDMSSAISNVSTALNGVIGYLSEVTSALLFVMLICNHL